MALRKMSQANGRKVTIPSSQIWDLAQRNIPNSRQHGNCFVIMAIFAVGGFVNGFKEYMRRQKHQKYYEKALYILHEFQGLN